MEAIVKFFYYSVYNMSDSDSPKGSPSGTGSPMDYDQYLSVFTDQNIIQQVNPSQIEEPDFLNVPAANVYPTPVVHTYLNNLQIKVSEEEEEEVEGAAEILLSFTNRGGLDRLGVARRLPN
jgi:hypothetical protein